MKVLPVATKIVKPASVLKKALPVASALGVLAGSSMGPGNPIRDAVHIAGSSVEDPFIEQLGYFGDKVLDLGHEVGDLAVDVAHGAVDCMLDAGAAIADGAEHVVEKIIETAIDVLG